MHTDTSQLVETKVVNQGRREAINLESEKHHLVSPTYYNLFIASAIS